jgi:hypothetical protein
MPCVTGGKSYHHESYSKTTVRTSNLNAEMKTVFATLLTFLLACSIVGCGPTSSTTDITADADQQKIDEYNALMEQQAKEREDWK